MPQAPPGFEELINKDNITRKDIQNYNNRAFDAYNYEVLVPCKVSKRIFINNLIFFVVDLLFFFILIFPNISCELCHRIVEEHSNQKVLFLIKKAASPAIL